MTLALMGAGPQVGGAAGVSIATPTAFWRLEDENDSGTNALHLTNVGTATFVAGKIGNALQCNQSPKRYLSHAHDALLTAGTGVAISFCCWAALTSNGDYHNIASKYGAGNPSRMEWFIQTSSAGSGNPWTWFVDLSDGTNTMEATTAVSTASGSYCFIVFVFDPARSAPNNVGISANGAAITWGSTRTGGSVNVANIQSTSLAPFYLGSYFGALDNASNAKIDAAGWWQGHALTDAEVAALYNSGAGKEYYSGAWH